MEFDLPLAWRILPQILEGTVTTLLMIPPILILAMAISVPVALARLSARPLLANGAWLFTMFFRGAPALILLYLVYNGMGTLGIVRESFLWRVFDSPFNCAVIALTFNHAGYVTEILRGAFRTVPSGLHDAACALALTRPQRFFLVVIPTAMRLGLSPYMNEVILLAKTTALVGAITVSDLMAVANSKVAATFDPFTPLVMAAAIYWSIVQLILFGFARLETHLNRHL